MQTYDTSNENKLEQRNWKLELMKSCYIEKQEHHEHHKKPLMDAVNVSNNKNSMFSSYPISESD